ncbi:hypothetical protein FOXB_01769 [Fusarium oxysporum f. sp. conglutinans Fo5176]|uniref:Transcription factor domain-containing protein n=1 Tax=Fusarium oxysporum (strain Fo5176) TaxID=660025 RepID=F9F5U4_FUSOF|nr:hypothetical protein FOXB_01769 [Fusarium oxysporum f. sp. conglutinans Fo5176]KAI8400431.1 hypothetical protein FOFC_19273 [Fusarium oxysporum]
MESRASPTEKRGFDRPAISRRSIGCDRATPCSNCVSARVDCTHSRIAPKTSTARHRVLVSEQYERKIDDISRDVSSIKSLLAGLDLNRLASAQTSHEQHHSASISSSPTEANNSEKLRPPATTAPLPRWDYSAHIIDFVQSIIQDNGSVQADTEWSSTISSLKSLANALESTRMTRSQQKKPHEPPESIPKPPLEAIVEILRWVKDHSRDYRVVWICRFLPLDVFLDICNKVYFRVEDHTEAEFIIANSFLSYVFAEYAVIHGDAKTQEYCRFYRSKVGNGLTKLTLLATPCMELIAALALGTLGYHRLDSPKDGHQHIQSDLFWVVYAYEKGLSLRLGRCSGVRDSEVSLTRQENQHRSIRLGRIQGKAYDQLYSPEGLTTSNATRCEVADSLSQELQSIIDETHHEIAQALTERRDMNDDPMKVIYLHCDLVCQSALTAMVLRVLPGSQGMEVHESCLTVARNTLDLHDQCMKLVNGCKDPLLIRRYINWAILHTPFFPFSIVFTHAVRYSIVEDFDRLDRFASSFKPESSQSEPATHPHRLYELLSKAARLSAKACPELSHTSESLSSSTDFTMIDPEAVNTVDEIAATDAIGTEYDASFQIGDWFHSNQQFMRLLHEDVPY